MKLRIVSDLHSEFFESIEKLRIFLGNIGFQNFKQDETLILLGDVGVPEMHYTLWKHTFFYLNLMFKKILYIPGNHEYYGSNFATIKEYMKELEKEYSSVIVLDNKVYREDNVKIIGSTLWFPKRNINIMYMAGMNDFKYIDEKLSTMEKEGGKAITFIKKELEGNGTKNIVATHFLPSLQSVPEQFKTSNLNSYFVNEKAEKLMLKYKPFYWLHGHTHSKCDYMIGETHIICNPYGYNKREFGLNLLFNKYLTIEV